MNLGLLAVDMQRDADLRFNEDMDLQQSKLKQTNKAVAGIDIWDRRMIAWEARVKDSATRDAALAEYESYRAEFETFWNETMDHLVQEEIIPEKIVCPLQEDSLKGLSSKKSVACLDKLLDDTKHYLSTTQEALRNTVQPVLIEIQRLTMLFDLMASVTKEMLRTYTTSMRSIIHNIRGA